MFSASVILIPIFLIILLGYVLKRIHFPGDPFWPALEKLTYFVFFPALLINNLSSMPLEQPDLLPMGLVLSSGILIMASFMLLLRRFLAIDGPAFSSVFQGVIRFNSYLGIAIAIKLYPHSGLLISAIALIAMIPLINVLCVIVLAHYASHKPTHWRIILQALLQNPLIIGCAIGISLNLIGLPPAPIIQDMLKLLGDATLPLGLFAVGAALRFSSVRDTGMPLLISTTLKLLLFPCLVWVSSYVFGLTDEIRHLAVMFAALPTASSAYILARQMGGDYTLMANMITLQTLIAAITLPLMLMWLN